MFIDKYEPDVKEQVIVAQGINCHHLSQYIVVGQNGVGYDGLSGEECMSSLKCDINQTAAPKVLVIKNNFDFKGTDALNKEYTIPYLTWLLTDSPLSELYVTGSVEELLETGVCIVRCDVPANLMLVACQALRYSWEFPTMVDSWGKLVGEGMDKSHALYFCQLIRNTGGVSASWGGNSLNTNHFIFPTDVNLNALLDFNKKVYKLTESLYSETGTYDGVKHTWEMGCLYDEVEGLIISGNKEVKHSFGGSIKTTDNVFTKVATTLKSLLEKHNEDTNSK